MVSDAPGGCGAAPANGDGDATADAAAEGEGNATADATAEGDELVAGDAAGFAAAVVG